ncbi:unnamed protein product [Paramecium octaurelia]|uniref:Uncharacterized protein n=1 Tax=Paramecium octaurelia TaxID=43137 RepID=A0A8S1UJ43_PAROT|nr:unnamed protein product [Paramecium octaurelia]
MNKENFNIIQEQQIFSFPLLICQGRTSFSIKNHNYNPQQQLDIKSSYKSQSFNLHQLFCDKQLTSPFSLNKPKYIYVNSKQHKCAGLK